MPKHQVIQARRTHESKLCTDYLEPGADQLSVARTVTSARAELFDTSSSVPGLMNTMKRSNDAGNRVQTAHTAQTVQTAHIAQTAQTDQTAQTAHIAQTVQTVQTI
jgi:membrane protease subunit (stomatin/prohibitin family)